MSDADARRLAERTAEAMRPDDLVTQTLGVAIEEVGPGYARASMRVRQEMLNGHRTCHGGYLFVLADTVFAYACNSYDRVTVASGASIEFLAPGYLGDLLTAVAEERYLGGKTGVYDVEVHNQNGVCLALFRGRSHRLQGSVTGDSAAGP
jgi:acyl-CoA thioesterase